jgi:Flp pilus assembly protein TadG
MNRRSFHAVVSEVAMNRSRWSATRLCQRQRGQVLVIAVLAMIAMIGGVALVLEGGNAYAHQRQAQNASDAVANAGATVLAEQLGGGTKTDADVANATKAIADANALTSYVGFYTDVTGHMLTTAGVQTTSTDAAAHVGVGPIPTGAQGVQVSGTQTFGTSFASVLGMTQFTVTADATAVTGVLSGGRFLPVVFPINIVDCEKNGDLGTGDTNWKLSDPPLTSPPHPHPVGPEYIVPLCKTNSGSFMILDLDGIKNNCDEEVTNPPALQWNTFPVDVATDNGNNCAGKMVDAVNALQGHVVMVPVCDGACETQGSGSHATYHIIKVAAFFVDYMSDSNNKNSLCQAGTSPTYGTPVTPIRGNGSSSCIAGWFVRYVTSGPVGAGPVTGAGAIGVQLIK